MRDFTSSSVRLRNPKELTLNPQSPTENNLLRSVNKSVESCDRVLSRISFPFFPWINTIASKNITNCNQSKVRLSLNSWSILSFKRSKVGISSSFPLFYNQTTVSCNGCGQGACMLCFPPWLDVTSILERDFPYLLHQAQTSALFSLASHPDALLPLVDVGRSSHEWQFFAGFFADLLCSCINWVRSTIYACTCFMHSTAS